MGSTEFVSAVVNLVSEPSIRKGLRRTDKRTKKRKKIIYFYKETIFERKSLLRNA